MGVSVYGSEGGGSIGEVVRQFVCQVSCVCLLFSGVFVSRHSKGCRKHSSSLHDIRY